MREISLALQKEVDRRMQLELDGDIDLNVQVAAVAGRKRGTSQSSGGGGGRAGGLDALFLGVPRTDPSSKQKIEELKAMVGTLKAELEKKRFELCCYIRRAGVTALTTPEMESDKLRCATTKEKRPASRSDVS